MDQRNHLAELGRSLVDRGQMCKFLCTGPLRHRFCQRDVDADNLRAPHLRQLAVGLPCPRMVAGQLCNYPLIVGDECGTEDVGPDSTKNMYHNIRIGLEAVLDNHPMPHTTAALNAILSTPASNTPAAFHAEINAAWEGVMEDCRHSDVSREFIRGRFSELQLPFAEQAFSGQLDPDGRRWSALILGHCFQANHAHRDDWGLLCGPHIRSRLERQHPSHQCRRTQTSSLARKKAN